MSLPLRINLDEKDYTYKIITKGITKETISIQINLDGMEYQLACNVNGEWNAVDATISDNSDLLYLELKKYHG